MIIKKYVANDEAQATAHLRKDLGPEAVVLNVRPVQAKGFLGWFAAKQVEVTAAVDPEQPFVYSEELEIKVINSNGDILQTSQFGDSSTEYRIDVGGELYVTNFKTPKTADEYTVEVWRMRNGFLLDTFTFLTTD